MMSEAKYRNRRRTGMLSKDRTSFRLICTIIVYVFLVVLFLAIIAPFYWMIISSFKTRGEIFNLDFSLIPRQVTISPYIRLITETGFLRWLFNSIVIGVVTATIGVFICSLAGFAFAKYHFRGKDFLFLLVLSSVMIPLIVNIIPNFCTNEQNTLGQYLSITYTPTLC